MPKNPAIYLDNNAATPVHSEVAEAVYGHLRSNFGNPSSVHHFGRESRKVLIRARDEIAEFFGMQPDEVLFTSGATEGLTMLLKGFAQERKPARIISSKCEHSAVYKNLKKLEEQGWVIDWLPCGRHGAVQSAAVEEALCDETALICLMAANNETGVKTDLAAIGRLAEAAGIPFIVDGVALVGKELFTIPSGVSAIAFSGQKMYGPKGVGVALVRRSLKVAPLIIGGGQQKGLRAGTENLPGIVGLQAAFTVLKRELPQAGEAMRELRDYFERLLKEKFPNIAVNGSGQRVSNTSNLCFPGADGETLLIRLDGKNIYCSHGSACTAGALEPSRVLLEMGLSRREASASLRFSLSYFTTKQEIERAVEEIEKCVL